MDRDHQLSADNTTGAVPPARIGCLESPYTPDVEALLFGITARTSSLREPLELFRLIARDKPLCDLMFRLGRFMLGRNTAVATGYDTRTRELVIDRVTARCGCEYEWGVHIAAYGKEAGITAAQAYSLVHGTGTDLCWSTEDRATLSFVDELHDTGQVSDPTWAEMSARFSDETGRPIMGLLDILGQRWTLRILWELREGPVGFRDLAARADSMSQSVLNRRLKELEAARLVMSDDKGWGLSREGARLLELLLPLSDFARKWAALVSRSDKSADGHRLPADIG